MRIDGEREPIGRGDIPRRAPKPGRTRCMLDWPLLAAFIALGAVACSATEGMQPKGISSKATKVTPQATSDSALPIAAVLDAPARYVGKSVTVEGELTEVLGPSILRLGGEAMGTQSPDILVMGAVGVADALGLTKASAGQNLILHATGKVRLFDRAQAKREFGIRMDDPAYSGYEGKPYVVARALAFATPGKHDRIGIGSRGANEGVPSDSVPALHAGSAGVFAGPFPDTGTLARVMGNPVAFYGAPVAVKGFVAEILDAKAFSLSPAPGLGGKGILVLGTIPGSPRLTAGSEVAVRGEVREFNRRRYERETGEDLDEALYWEWDGRPFIRALAMQLIDSPTAAALPANGTGGSGYREADSTEAGNPTSHAGMR